MRRARILMTNSEYSRQEIWRNTGIPADRVRVVYHGIPELDRAGGPLAAGFGNPERPLALTVGIVDRTNLERKGLRAFVAGRRARARGGLRRRRQASRMTPPPSSQRSAGANVRLTGWLEDEELRTLLRARAAVYVQASKHEGFGVSVAEAMLARCVPVIDARRGAARGRRRHRRAARRRAAGDRRARRPRGAASRAPARRPASGCCERFSVEQRRAGMFALLDELI